MIPLGNEEVEEVEEDDEDVGDAENDALAMAMMADVCVYPYHLYVHTQKGREMEQRPGRLRMTKDLHRISLERTIPAPRDYPGDHDDDTRRKRLSRRWCF